MDAPTIITSVISQTGTDASRATILSILNERYQQQVADSQWLLRTTTIGTTTAGVSTYPFSGIIGGTEVVEILGLRVNSIPWDRVGMQDIWDLQAGNIKASFPNGGGLYSPSYDASGGAYVQLYPTPGASGQTIDCLAATLPAPLTDVNGVTPVVPTDAHGSLIDGTSATILARIDERPDLAQPYEDRFAVATEKLRRRKNSLLRGRGPVQIQVAGYHWDNR